MSFMFIVEDRGYYNDKLFGAVTEYQYTYRNTNMDEICFYLPNVS